MKLSEIASENDLREWLHEKAPIIVDVQLQWVEPNIYGSSIGCADVIMKWRNEKVDVELKYLISTRTGIKYTLRPSQRRYHHMSMRRGGRTALLAVCNELGQNCMFLVRGDHIPLRDYASDPGSGCVGGRVPSRVVNVHDVTAINRLKGILFQDPSFWEAPLLQTRRVVAPDGNG